MSDNTFLEGKHLGGGTVLFENAITVPQDDLISYLEKEKEQIIKTSKESYEYPFIIRGILIPRGEPNLVSETYSENYYNRNFKNK